MAVNSGIGWTHHTLNFWWGCHKVSEECRHCYISPIMKRAGKEPFGGPIRTSQRLWNDAHRFEKLAIATGERQRVFTCSMSDFFHPGADAWRPEAWEVIRQTPHLDWLIVTKRIEEAQTRLPADWGDGWPNVWLGVTCGHSDSLHRVLRLLEAPAALRFVSAEPLLGPLDFTRLDGSVNALGEQRTSYGVVIAERLGPRIDWIITGCERAAKETRRRQEVEWVRSIDEQCRRHGIPHFQKQYYRTDAQGNEVGDVCDDGLLLGEFRQEVTVTEELRTDCCGRDVTDLPGLWDDADTVTRIPVRRVTR